MRVFSVLLLMLMFVFLMGNAFAEDSGENSEIDATQSSKFIQHSPWWGIFCASIEFEGIPPNIPNLKWRLNGGAWKPMAITAIFDKLDWNKKYTIEF